MAVELVEATAPPARLADNKWKVILAKGDQQGSSGYYAESMLKEFGPAALPANSKAFITHNPERDPRDMFGFYPEGSVYEDGVGWTAVLEVFPHYKELVETIAAHTGLSIFMEGEKDKDGNVTKLLPNRMNSVDLVSFPGLDGSGIVGKMYESARAFVPTKRTVESSADEKGTTMDKDIEARFDAIAKSLSAVATLFAESKSAEDKAAQKTADKAAVSAAVETALDEFSAKAKLVSEAALSPAQTDAIMAEARKGADVAPLIETAKKVAEEIKKGLQEARQEEGYSISSGIKTESAAKFAKGIW